MPASLEIQRFATSDLPPATRAAVLALCNAAYQEPMEPYLEAMVPGEHLLGLRADNLVSHLMWVTRWLQPAGMQPLRTAYVELVATAPEVQGHGYATQLLKAFPSLVRDHDLAALSPGHRPSVRPPWVALLARAARCASPGQARAHSRRARYDPPTSAHARTG